MNIRIAAAAVCAFVGVGVAGIAIAQTMWPQITASDLQACRNVIAQAHKKQQGVISAEITQYCTAGSRDYQADSCASMRQWMNESKAQDDVAWYVKGQSSCEGGDYPCYGPEIFNDPRTGSDVAYWVDIFEKKVAQGTTITADMDFWDSADRADNCAAGLWLKKYKAASGSGTTAKAAPAPTPAPAPTKITANDPTFQSNLNQFGADQLLALTNELLETGSVDLAKLARNALLQRFPDSPLVPVVAQLITSASKNGTPAGTPAPPPVSNKSASSAKPAATVAAAAGDRFYINDLPTLVSTFARIGVIMNPVSGSTLEAQESTNLFTAYLSDCSGSRCYAIQLLAKYALTPMPTQDKVQTWNIDKLYGRGYVSGNRVNFDMVLRIPDGGIDIKTLDDFVVLYKGATNSFYNLVKPQ